MDLSVFGNLDDAITLCGFSFLKEPPNRVFVLLIAGHITKQNFGVRIGFMAAGLVVGIVSRFI